MINIQDFIRENDTFRTYKIDSLLFAEFKCPPDKSTSMVWCENNYFTFILNGETILKTTRNEFQLHSEDCVFIKKGAILIERSSQENFCQLMVFVPDDFIRSVIHKYKIELNTETETSEYHQLFQLNASEVTRAYFHSLLEYFDKSEPPPSALLKVKFEELLVSLLSGSKQGALKKYFYSLSQSSSPSLKEIMDNTFTYNLTTPEFAKLCARSVSAFKTEFYKIYQSTPGKWIQKMRLEYSRYLIDSSGYTFDEICSMSGLVNKSRFYRIFKNIYGMTPTQYRMRIKPASDSV